MIKQKPGKFIDIKDQYQKNSIKPIEVGGKKIIS
jgi:hypothetical protein